MIPVIYLKFYSWFVLSVYFIPGFICYPGCFPASALAEKYIQLLYRQSAVFITEEKHMQYLYMQVYLNL
jgi:hypothetical protein